jgi:xanthine dehydrogenase accessory factor
MLAAATRRRGLAVSDTIAVWDALVAARSAGGGGWAALVVGVQGHAPQVVGARLILRDDGVVVGTIGGGAVEHEVLARARAWTGGPGVVRLLLTAELGMCCGGAMDVYIERFDPAPALLVLGAGHVGAATARLALSVGFAVTVADARADWNHPDRLPDPIRRAVGAPGDAVGAAAARATDAVLVCTHDHDLDKQLLSAALRRGFGYVGMIGSTRKVARAVDHLRLDGHEDAAIAAVHMPVGLDLAAETPEEIAVAIVGELVRWRRRPTSRKTTRGAAV